MNFSSRWQWWWLVAGLCVAGGPARAWDYEAHRVVNQLALASLPANFPAFALTPEARERVAFLSGEPDRWRNTKDSAGSHANGPDHYVDMEELTDYGIKPSDLTPFRYDFAARVALARAAAPDKFPKPDAARNEDHTREWPGFLPWALAEYYGKLKAAFGYWKALQEHGGTPAEIRNAELNIIGLMGTMGHFAGDGAQPLHTTIHHHGWVGANPNGYTTNGTFHQWIDGSFMAKSGGVEAAKLSDQVRPAQVLPDTGRGVEVFAVIVPFLVAGNGRVEPLYQQEKAGNLTPGTEKTAAGRAFLEARILEGGQLLGDLWLSAWQHAPDDKYLKARLAERAAGTNAPAAK